MRGEDLPVSVHWKQGKVRCIVTLNLNAALVYIDQLSVKDIDNYW